MPDFQNGKFFTSADLVKLDPDPMCASLPFQPRIINNTWLQLQMHCWRHWYYVGLRGLKTAETSAHLTFGTLLHQGADIWTKGTALGLEPPDALDAALEHVLVESWPMGDEKDVFGGQYVEVYQCSDRTKTVTKKGIKRCEFSYREHLWHNDDNCQGCGREIERRTAYHCPEKVKNRRSLIRAVVTLCDHLAGANIRAMRLEDGRIGSELRWFRELPLASPDGTPYLMTGSYDGAALEGQLALPIGPEYKTTQREPNDAYFASMCASPQCLTYSWSGVQDFGKQFRVLYIVLYLTGGSCEIVTKRVYLAPDQLQEWEDDMLSYIREGEIRAGLAADLEGRGLDPIAAYPRRLSACHSLPGATSTPCEFLRVCTQPRCDREGSLDNNFKVEHYNPLGTRETEVKEEE